MSDVVFLGPSLLYSEAQLIYPNADYRPPAACGDILKAIDEQPARIILIDGYFHYRPAVWHKEILYAMERGITVYGAASMGALRAAELSEFGMIGVGKIYEEFFKEILTDDDEVAVLHKNEFSNFHSVSDAMVNIRATLKKAVFEGVIEEGFCFYALENLKYMFYPDRNLGKWLISEDSVPAKSLLLWIQDKGMVDQKREDAKKCLQSLYLDDLARKEVFCQKTMVFTALRDQIKCCKYDEIPAEEKLLKFCKNAEPKIPFFDYMKNEQFQELEVRKILSTIFDPDFFELEEGLFCLEVIFRLISILQSKNVVISNSRSEKMLEGFDIELDESLVKIGGLTLFVLVDLLDSARLGFFFRDEETSDCF